MRNIMKFYTKIWSKKNIKKMQIINAILSMETFLLLLKTQSEINKNKK